MPESWNRRRVGALQPLKLAVEQHYSVMNKLSPAEYMLTRETLREASVPALVASLVLLTGDMKLLERWDRSAPAFLGDVNAGFTAEQKDEIFSAALRLLTDRETSPAQRRPLPSREDLRKIMNWVAGEEVPEEYMPFLLEEVSFEGGDPKQLHWNEKPSPAVLDDFHIVVIGGGIAGVCMAIRLGQAGIPYTLIEKNSGIGGTWLENTYPDCRVDSPNHFYQFSFEPNPDWSRFFSPQEELRAYVERVAGKHRIGEHVRLRTEVVSATYGENRGTWSVLTRDADGREERIDANVIVSAVGMLNRPRYPDINGLETFKGPVFHTARWEHRHDLRGKRIAVIGTGSSSMQVSPALGRIAERLFVFQRSAQWAFFSPDYHKVVSRRLNWVMHNVPYYQQWYRFMHLWAASDRIHHLMRRDRDWPHQHRSINAMNDAFRGQMVAVMKERMGNRPDLWEKAIPNYPFFGRRPLLDNNWFEFITHDNVDLVTDGIREVTEDAIVTDNGDRHQVDAIVLATGFHAGRFLWPMDIYGKGGKRLHDLWEEGENPRAYLGITVPDFPNLFCLYGPNTNPTGGNLFLTLENQVRYISGCLFEMLESGRTVMECRRDVFDEYNARLDIELAEMSWSHPNARSYYNNSEGRVITNMPWKVLDYWRMIKAPDLSDFEFNESR